MRKILPAILLFNSLSNYLPAQSWSTVGTGVGSSNYSAVHAIATYAGDLYVGGYFTAAGGIPANNMAKWNGLTWSSVGSGLNGQVNTICEFNGELYAGGYFPTAGSVSVNNIAKWNGVNWSAVGSVDNAGISSLAVYNGELYAAGYFYNIGGPYGTGILKWNGSTWSVVGGGVGPVINSAECLAVYNGELYAAGANIGDGGVAQSFSIVKWNGIIWSTVATTPAVYSLDGALGDIFSLAVYNGELYAAGTFVMMDTIPASQIAKWNGTGWSAVGTGINFEVWPYGDGDGASYSFVRSLAVYKGSLYAGGRFISCGTISTINVARWDGANWSALSNGVNGNVYAMAAGDTSLYVGGRFNYVNGTSIPAGNFARWTESCNAAPPQPVIINGNDTSCRGAQQVYYVNDISGTSSYSWSLPPGWTGHSTSNSITVVVGSSGGTISVSAKNSCGNSVAQRLNVTVLQDSLPVIPGLITGNNVPCIGSVQTYNITRASNADNYTWYLPPGWIGSSTDTGITVTTSASNGTIAVTANNNCGSSTPRILPVTVTLPPQKPEFIDGARSVCIGTSQLYFVTPSQPFTNYSWILPQGWTGNSDTDSIVITPGNNDGLISVNAYNSCGNSDYQTFTITVDSISEKPGPITGNIYTTTDHVNNYSIVPVAGATGYNWTATGAIIQGKNNPAISAIWKNAGVYELSVQSKNNCGISATQKLIINVSEFDPVDPFDLQILPNPSGGDVYIKAKRMQDKMIAVDVFTINSQILYRSGKRSGSNDYTQFISLKNLTQGVYVIKVTIGDTVYVRKIIIHK